MYLHWCDCGLFQSGHLMLLYLTADKGKWGIQENKEKLVKGYLWAEEQPAHLQADYTQVPLANADPWRCHSPFKKIKPTHVSTDENGLSFVVASNKPRALPNGLSRLGWHTLTSPFNEVRFPQGVTCPLSLVADALKLFSLKHLWMTLKGRWPVHLVVTHKVLVTLVLFGHRIHVVRFRKKSAMFVKCSQTTAWFSLEKRVVNFCP